ncbi:Gfo/Idh/MocA family oxidoreductase [Aurantimonas sp. Leaf443]|uniref:Gfo/Idh/MocA family protein n=1 Tax=Aurantimonas sp. Leaf443 TaxID=1736378 RepID=UPI000AAEC245|nr:Gfo/Idh/MocA family oxidoreductase [Aurantimonas sp. Leaf443]
MTNSPIDPTRRLFVGTLALGLGGIVAGRGAAAQEAIPATPVGRPEPELESPPPEPLASRLGWAVAGLGDFAQGYVIPKGLGGARRAKLTGLVSGNRDKALKVAARQGVPEGSIYDYAMTGLADDASIDIVYVVTPNSTHQELAIRALEAGKHVMCEKPMANSSRECQRMIDAAKAADRRLMVAYRAHFEPSNVRVKEMIDAGEIGPITFASSDHHRPLDLSLPRDQWRAKRTIAGGGSLVDIGIYSLNGLIWFLGETPSRVCATLHSPPDDPRFAEVEDLMTAQLVFPSGARANISSSYSSNTKRIDLFGAKAVAKLDPATSYSGNRLTVSTPEANEQVVTKEPSEVQFSNEIDHLCEAISTGSAIRTPGEMGLRDVHIIHALYRSAAEGRWIDLNENGSAKDG